MQGHFSIVYTVMGWWRACQTMSNSLWRLKTAQDKSYDEIPWTYSCHKRLRKRLKDQLGVQLATCRQNMTEHGAPWQTLKKQKAGAPRAPSLALTWARQPSKAAPGRDGGDDAKGGLAAWPWMPWFLHFFLSFSNWMSDMWVTCLDLFFDKKCHTYPQ